MRTRVALVGAGAIGAQHARALAAIDEAVLQCVASRTVDEAARFAADHGVPDIAESLAAVLRRDDIDAVILATPTQMHAREAVQCMDAGKHVLVEIPMADSARSARFVHAVSLSSPVVAMVAHTSRYYPSNIQMRRLIESGQFHLQHLIAHTGFLRRSNINALGEPRVWTDNLLWHHAAHTIDLFAWQAGSIVEAQTLLGPVHPELGIAMDLAILLRATSGALCTLSLSFNDDGPNGSTWRYIGDSGTFVARRLGLQDGHGKPIDLSPLDHPESAVEIQDREFIGAIRERRMPLTAIEVSDETYRVIEMLDTCNGKA